MLRMFDVLGRVARGGGVLTIGGNRLPLVIVRRATALTVVLTTVGCRTAPTVFVMVAGLPMMLIVPVAPLTAIKDQRRTALNIPWRRRTVAIGLVSRSIYRRRIAITRGRDGRVAATQR